MGFWSNVGNFFKEFGLTISTGGFYLIYKIGKSAYDTNKEFEKLKKQLNSSSSSTSKRTVEDLPYLRGASNQVSTNKTQPYIIGKHLITPMILNGGKAKNSLGYHYIKNGAIYWNVVFECGFNKQVLKKIYMSDIVLKTFNDTTPQEGIFNIDSSVFAEDGLIEIAQDGLDFSTQTFNKKIVEVEKSDNLKKSDDEDYKPLYFTLEKNSMSADICICFNGLTYYDKNGKQGATTRNVTPAYSLDYATILANGGNVETATWTNFSFENGNAFSGNTLKQVYYNAHIDFSYSQVKNLTNPVTIRLSTTDKKVIEGQSIDDCYCKWIHSYIYDSVKSEANNNFVAERIIEERAAKQSTLLGLQIKSTEANADKTDSIQVITQGLARKLVNNEFETEKTETSNPASWLLEILTSDKHTPSKLDEEDIDIESLKDWYTFCENKNIEVNFVISQGMTKSAIISQILSIGRASAYRDIITGKFAVVYDDVKESNNVPLINEQSVISFSYQKDMSRFPDGVIVSYVDANSEYNETSYVLMYDRYKDNVDLWKYPEQRNEDSVLTQIDSKGCTNYEQSFKNALYTMKCANLRRKTATAEIGLEGITYKPLSKVLVQHPTLKIGLGSSEIESIIKDENNKIVGVKLYQKFLMEEGKTYNAIIQHIYLGNVFEKSVKLKTEIGLNDEIYFETNIDNIAKGDILSYGYGIETITSPMLITGISQNESSVTLTLADYDSRVYSEAEDIPDYIPNITQPSTSVVAIEKPSTDIGLIHKTVANAIADIDLEDLNFAESPNVYTEKSSVFFSVNDEGKTPIAQVIKSEITIIQDNKKLDFIFGQIENIPEGFEITTNFHTVIIKVNANVRVIPDSIKIPVLTRRYLHSFEYGDEDEVVYVDENGEEYGYYEFAPELTTYETTITWTGVKGGTKLDSISNVANIPAKAIIGDYFVYTGEPTTKYKKSAVYTWNGSDWVIDTNDAHVSSSLSDILSVVNSDLQTNNSKAWEYLDHLTANEIFVNRLLANEAFINKLVANSAFITSLNAKYLQTTELTADKIKGLTGVFDNIEVSNAVIKVNCKINGNLDNGYIKTNSLGSLIDYNGLAKECPFLEAASDAYYNAKNKLVQLYNCYYFDTNLNNIRRWFEIAVSDTSFQPYQSGDTRVLPANAQISLTGYKNLNDGGVFLPCIEQIKGSELDFYTENKIYVDENGFLRLLKS